ncbi:MAG TPA: nucleotidyltransferase domain-containing protein [Gemmataceae bacterium]|nr:nucleotidyltransferase domain-containing protein [Gemmataceae bacterium]
MSAIRRYARQIAERFKPDKIILFGSFAYGTPHGDSDVDLLVVMPAAREVTQAVRILLAYDHPFPLDLIVRTPEKLARCLKDGNQFLHEIVAKGRVLYEKGNAPLGRKGRGRLQRRAQSRKAKGPVS